MKKLAFIAIFSALILSLFSCEKNDGAPEGMQLVRGGEEYGYNFYAPEEWTVANNGDIAAAYASKIDVSSVTLAPAKAPLSDIQSYFESSLAEFSYEITNTPELSACDFGNAESAYKAIYDFKYGEHSFRSMQIYASFSGRFYIFTFTAQLVERGDGVTYYDFYLEKVQKVIDNVKFTEITSPAAPEYSKDSDGYLLVSDKKICGYELFIHPEWSVRYAQSNIGISRPDGASANISEATSVGVSYKQYFENRIEELSKLVTDIEVLSGENGTETALGNSTRAIAYEYTYKYNGISYHVYQIIAVAGDWPVQDGYVFTYTAPESVYELHLAEVTKMIEKVNFR